VDILLSFHNLNAWLVEIVGGLTLIVGIVWLVLIFAWLLIVILLSAFAIVRHAECLALKLGEPVGTLILTLSVIGIEVMMISASMVTGKGSPTLARDAMFSVVMIVLNGLVGLSLVLGALRFREQSYNLQGAGVYLAMIASLAVLGLTHGFEAPDFVVISEEDILGDRMVRSRGRTRRSRRSPTACGRSPTATPRPTYTTPPGR
jgi:Ca2+:H+ antiporter